MNNLYNTYIAQWLLILALGSTLAACGGSQTAESLDMPQATVADQKPTAEMPLSASTKLVAMDSVSFGTRCSALSQARIGIPISLSTTVVADDGQYPQHCLIQGKIDDRIGFQMRVARNWNERFLMEGTGGLVGFVKDAFGTLEGQFSTGKLAQGWAVATTDSGHTGAIRPELYEEPSLDGSWGLNNPVAEKDFADRAIRLTTRVSKLLLEALFTHKPTRSYMAGCSQGGRETLIAAERFPEEFDGFIAGSPGWNSVDGLFASWNQTAKLYTRTRFDLNAVQTVQKTVRAQCDGLDGIVDGIVSTPERCKPNLERVRCGVFPTAACLTNAQIDTVYKTWSGLTNSVGKTLINGFWPTGNELGTGDFDGWVGNFSGGGELAPGVPLTAEGTAAFLLQQEVYRYLVFQPDRPTFDYRAFDYVAERPNYAAAAKLYDVGKRDFSHFRPQGKKILVHSGMSDFAISPKEQVRFFDEVTAASGGRSVAQSFLRLYLVPARQHCGAGAFDQYDPLEAVVKWVEKGQAPHELLANSSDGEYKGRTRYLCPHPQRSMYRGSGSPMNASSFRCE
jgi:Tannase and feruloyl esterase